MLADPCEKCTADICPHPCPKKLGQRKKGEATLQEKIEVIEELIVLDQLVFSNKLLTDFD